MSVPTAALSLFISYSHRDDALRQRLDTHLALLRRQKVFDVWHDRRIGAGQDWAGSIDQALERADIVMLLVSADFLASDYCYDTEVARALQRHADGSARVVPVILRPCDWQSSPFGRLQALPQDGVPVVSHADIDVALTEVARRLRALADEIRGSAHPTRPGADAVDAPTPSPPPRRWPTARAWALAGLGLAGALGASALAYTVAVKPPLDEARALMRRGDYAGAERVLQALPRPAGALPWVAALAEPAGFGARLAAGTHIRTLAPELARLQQRFPDAADVAVFAGLKAYWVDNDAQQAYLHFSHAAAADPAHAEAHALALGRQIDLAYEALGRSDPAQARAAAAQARALADRALGKSAADMSLPRYAHQLAELQELEGDTAGAYAAYARLAALQALSALQSAFVSWRLAEPAAALRSGLEAAEAAGARVDAAGGSAAEAEGWVFRLTATELVDVRGPLDKRCLLAWAAQVSTSLQAGVEGSAAEAAAGKTPPRPCADNAEAARLRDIVCVQLLSAAQQIGADDTRQAVLAQWRAGGLRCAPGLLPLPTLPPAGAIKPAATARAQGTGADHGHTLG